ncbi:PREDICTED: transcription factor PAR1-like [Ipomoea nil]|uniref:transcription factor PAR1-like n=1 Tax=Ipomoea nil TaxID=35883 RepID=UPI00090113B5|nr:PREDICTED: transcription factor PAR1-like [Ipomoea nil]
MVSTTTGTNKTACEEPRPIPAFPTKHKLSPASDQLPGISNALEDSLSGCRRARLPEVHRRTQFKKVVGNSMKGSDSNDEGEEAAAAAADEKAEVEKKILALQRIVPGGESLGVDKLFEETAGYILALQFQVKALRAVTSFVEGSEKEKRKLGG